jgi:hypothetical protein
MVAIAVFEDPGTGFDKIKGGVQMAACGVHGGTAEVSYIFHMGRIN